MLGRAWLLLVAVGLALPTVARAEPKPENEPDPVRVTPERKTLRERRAQWRTKDFSEAGTRKGILEFGLGSLTAALALGLIGRGTWELVKGQQLLDACALDVSADPLCVEDRPAVRHEIAAGLSFGFVVPAAVASGFLFWRGARTLRDYRRFHAQSDVQATLAPSVDRDGASLTLRLRF